MLPLIAQDATAAELHAEFCVSGAFLLLVFPSQIFSVQERAKKDQKRVCVSSHTFVQLAEV